MKKLMASAVLVVVALSAAPALAENVPVGGPDTTVSEAPPGPIDGAPGEEGPGMISPPIEEAAPPPPIEETAPPPPIEETVPAPPSEDPVPPPPSEDSIEDTVDTGEVPVEDTTPEDTGSGNADDASEDTTEAPNADDTALDTGDNTGDSEDTDEQEADSGDDTVVDTGNGKHHKDKTDDEDKKDDDDDESDDPEQSQDQEADSGDVDQSVNITNTGDNVNMCIGVLQNANTGNSQNQEGVVQDDSEADEVELESGSRITVTPQLVVDCRQLILQIVMGQQPKESNNLKSSQPRSVGVQVRGGSPQVRGGSQPRPISTRADAKAAQRPNATPRALPRTGGISGLDIALLGLCASAPLIGGGLFLRRILR
jgi:hypothetical protein